jgi:hypothetical protein
MVQFSAPRCSCMAILRVSLVSFAAITLRVASQRVFIVVVYFVIDSVLELLDTPSYDTVSVTKGLSRDSAEVLHCHANTRLQT